MRMLGVSSITSKCGTLFCSIAGLKTIIHKGTLNTIKNGTTTFAVVPFKAQSNESVP